VLVLGKTTRPTSVAVQPLKKDVKKKCRYRTSSELENSVLEINHVTNMTKVLNDTTASDRVSRSNYRNKHLCDILTSVFLIREMITNDSENSNLIIFEKGLKYVRGISRYISLFLASTVNALHRNAHIWH